MSLTTRLPKCLSIESISSDGSCGCYGALLPKHENQWQAAFSKFHSFTQIFVHTCLLLTACCVSDCVSAGMCPCPAQIFSKVSTARHTPDFQCVLTCTLASRWPHPVSVRCPHLVRCLDERVPWVLGPSRVCESLRGYSEMYLVWLHLSIL